MKGIFEQLSLLSSLDGISGDEDLVRRAIITEIQSHCHYQVDNMGNLICFKKGVVIPSKRLMICAHMDEVGMIVTGITEDGLLRFTSVGGIDQRVVLGRSVRLYRAGINGVIGTKAVHMSSASERETAVKMDDMYIDIGASSKAQAQQVIRLGDSVAFIGEYGELGNGYIKGKALDDRVGCAIMIEMIRSKIKYDTYFVFTTQEETGLRGARTAAYTVSPDVAIVLETTTAADLTGVPAQKQVCTLGKGAVVGFMDRSTIYDKELFQLAFSLAEKNHIPCQTKSMVAGGNDAGAIHTSRGGVKTIAVSVPTRYLHSPYCVVKKEDVESVAKLAGLLAEHVL